MRSTPLLLVLDEPAVALDATAEHTLFERYATSVRQSSQGSEAAICPISWRWVPSSTSRPRSSTAIRSAMSTGMPPGEAPAGP